MRHVLLVVAATVALSATSAHAQPQPADTIDREQVIETLNSETVAPALAVVTGNHVVAADVDGRPFISAIAANGLHFELHFRACEEGGTDACQAVSLVARWERNETQDEDRLRDYVSNFARGNAVVSPGMLEDGSPFVSRYVIADHGIAQGNLLSEFYNFVLGASLFGDGLLALPQQP